MSSNFQHDTNQSFNAQHEAGKAMLKRNGEEATVVSSLFATTA